MLRTADQNIPYVQTGLGDKTLSNTVKNIHAPHAQTDLLLEA